MTILYVWIMFGLFKAATGAYTAAMETTIRSETVLAASYDYISRPIAQTTIKVGLNILAIDELDLKSQKFSAAGWLTFEWEDSRLTWTKASRGDIEYIFSKPGVIWKPELVIDNSLESLGVISDTELYLRIKDDGTVEWEPPTLFVTHCQVDITYYPYDQQKCAIEIVSWGYTLSEVKLEHLRTAINLEDFQTHGEWTVVSSRLSESTLTETASDGTVHSFPKLSFWLYMQRRTDFYNLNVMMPIFLTSLLIVLVFVVPVESGEKLSYVLTVLLALAVLLTLVADSLPPTSISTSVLGLYLGIVMVLAALAVLLTVVILIMYHKEGKPNGRQLCVRLMARFSCHSIGKRRGNNFLTKVVPSDERPVSSQNAAEDVELSLFSWQDVSSILDRFCFINFTIITVVINIAFIITLVAGGKATDP